MLLEYGKTKILSYESLSVKTYLVRLSEKSRTMLSLKSLQDNHPSLLGTAVFCIILIFFNWPIAKQFLFTGSAKNSLNCRR